MRKGAGLLVGIVIATQLARGQAGCSYVPCYYGTYPPQGATRVPLDAVLRFVGGDEITSDLPALSQAIHLRRVDGAVAQAVPFSVRLDARAHTVEVHPDAPLAPDATYELDGIDPRQVSRQHFGYALDRDPAITRFETGGALHPIGAWRTEEDVIVVVFSEPVDADAIGASLDVTDGDGAAVDFEVLGALAGAPRAIEIADDGSAYAVTYGETEVLVDDGYEAQAAVDWHVGRPACGDTVTADSGSGGFYTFRYGSAR